MRKYLVVAVVIVILIALILWKERYTKPKRIIVDKTGSEMVLIPAGEFTMGDNTAAHATGLPMYEERPEHIVYLDAFYMDRYEVTNEQYRRFMEATNREKQPKYWGDERYNKPSYPVVGVDWLDARDYCQWAGTRLPTEAEWEKAARGTVNTRKFPWGDEMPDAGGIYRANYAVKEDGYKYTAPVGSFPEGASPYGLLDMAGNVEEWVADYYDKRYYTTGPIVNPKGPAKATMHRGLRGGAFISNPRYMRTSFRAYDFQDHTTDKIGFRCAKSVD